jgi:hypothetical protein
VTLDTASFRESQQRATGSDLDVVRMGRETYQLKRSGRQA